MRVVLTGASGQLGAYLRRPAARARGTSRRPGAARTPGDRGGVALRPVDLTDAEAIGPGPGGGRPRGDHPRGGDERGRGGPPRPGAGRAVNVEATATARRLVRPAAAGGWSSPRPTWSSTARALEPRGRPGRAGPRLRPDQARGRAGRAGRPGRPGGPAQPALRPVAVGPADVLRPDDRRAPAGRAADVLRGRVPDAARPGHRRRGPGPPGRVGRDRACSTSPGRERVSRFELIRRVAAALGLDPALVRANRQARRRPRPSPGPPTSRSTPTRLAALLPDLDRPTIEEAVARMHGVTGEFRNRRSRD